MISGEGSSGSSEVQCADTSRASPVPESEVVRSRTWSADITRTWNAPVHGLESLQERKERYSLYFQMTSEQLRFIYDKFITEMNVGLEIGRAQYKTSWDRTRCSLKMMDTCILDKWIPRGRETGESIALDFGSTEPGTVLAANVGFTNKKYCITSAKSIQLRDACKDLPKGLLDKNATACQLFDALASLVKAAFPEKLTKCSEDEPLPVALSVTFPLEQRSIFSGSLIHWTGGFETGRAALDPVEGVDFVALLDCAFQRLGVPARTVAVLNDTAATLLCSIYEKPLKNPACAVAFVLGDGVNGCYIQSHSGLSSKSSIINCEVGNFDKSLPANDVDLEIDFADDTTKGLQLFEKMVSTAYLGELCRRLVLKVWQSNAPPLAWVRYSMPWYACAQVIMDCTENLETTGKILSGLWDWDTGMSERHAVQSLFHVVFDRSAALVAVAIVALSSRTERLQPAMGGLTCAISGSLYSKCPFYADAMKSYLSKVLDNNTSNLIRFQSVEQGAAKGAAALCYCLTKSDHAKGV